MLERVLLPAVFVLVWSTGFVVGRGVAEVADGQLFLVGRFLGAGLLYVILAAICKDRFPRGRELLSHLAVGALSTGVYTGASWFVVGRGLNAGVMALIGATQPLMTIAVMALLWRVRPPRLLAVGIVIGTVGILGVLSPALTTGSSSGIDLALVAIGTVGVVALTAGTLMQRSLGSAPLRSAAAVQSLGGAGVSLLATLVLDEHRFDWGWPSLGLMAYSVLVLSGLGVVMLIHMMRTQDPAKVSMLLLLTPPLAAIESYVLFHDHLAPVQVGGMVLALVGVGLGQWRGSNPRSAAGAGSRHT